LLDASLPIACSILVSCPYLHLGFAFVAYPNRDSTPYKERYNIPEAETIIRGVRHLLNAPSSLCKRQQTFPFRSNANAARLQTLRYEGFPEFVKVLVDIGFLSDEEQSFLKEPITWKEATQKILDASSSSENDLIWAVSSKTTFKDNDEKNRLIAGLMWGE
jgi:saccharopine dehydrogenase (NADP+, L-glutamate forming)